MEFSYSSKTEPLKSLAILNNNFKNVRKCRFLGVYFNENLSWNDQIQHVLSQVSKSCGIMYQVRNFVPSKILRKIYLALIQPYLVYCAPLWGASKNSLDIQKLFILQKKCIRIVSNKTVKQNNMFEHTKPLFFRLQILNIFNIYTYMTACEAMKIVVSAIPKSIKDKFTFSERSDRIILPKFNLVSTMKRSFVYNSAKILNYLLEHDIIYN